MDAPHHDGKPRKTLRRIKPHAKLIEAIGGPTALAAAIASQFKIKLRPLTVSMWAQRVIPHRYRSAVAAIARRQGMAEFIPGNFTIGG